MHMKWDVIYVTYNSEKWIRPCFSSWEDEPMKSSVNVIVIDNGSSDGTLDALEDVKQEMGTRFAGFHILAEKENYGFGVANNIAASYGREKCVSAEAGDCLCFLNIDTEIQKGMFEELTNYMFQSDNTVGMWELRQIPFEHPKYYDPVTLETSWCSGAAFVIRRKIFEEVGGFDKDFFMYAEDVDISWKVRMAGYSVMYCPKAIIRHNSYCVKGEVKPLQYGYSMRNNLLMRCRYGTSKDVRTGWILVLKLLLTNHMGWTFNRKFLKTVNGYFGLRKNFAPIKSRCKSGGEVAYFHGLDYAQARYGAFQETGALEFLAEGRKCRVWTFILEAKPENASASHAGRDNIADTVPGFESDVSSRMTSDMSSECISRTEQSLRNATVPSETVQAVDSLREVAEKLDAYIDQNVKEERKAKEDTAPKCYVEYMESEKMWINILCRNRLVFADHNEFLLSIAMAEDPIKSVVCSVDESGQKGKDLSFYLLDLEFYRRNRNLFVDNDMQELVKLCMDSAVVGEKQTVI